jgi:hypothetical protein
VSPFEELALNLKNLDINSAVEEILQTAEPRFEILSNQAPEYPASHKAGMRVPKGGSSCASCEYLADNKTDCTNKYFQEWHGSEKIPGPIDSYCSDWYEAKDGLEAEGTSEGVQKAWDTRGRGRKQATPTGHPKPKDWDAKTGFLHDGVDVAIFDRYKNTNPDAVSVRTFLHNPPPEADKRQELADAFKQAVPTGKEDVDIQTLIPTQNTVFKAGLEKITLEGLYPNPVTVFRYKGNDYLMDGHHRVLASVIDGRGSVEANVFQLKSKKELDAARKLEGRTEFRGLDISIETDKGSVRKGIGKDGKPWEVKMTYPYGYIRMTQGVDGDHHDVFLGDDEDAENVYVVHTNEPTTGEYDEDKSFVGFPSAEAAKKAFLENYSNPKFFGSMDTLPFEKFKEKVLQTKDDPQRIAAYGTSEEGLDIGAAVSDLLGSGTSEGAEKGWDTRGRGRKAKDLADLDEEALDAELRRLLQGYPSSESPKGGEYYHGTISEAVKKILKEGLKQNEDLKFDALDPVRQMKMASENGYVYLTKAKNIGQWYGMFKAKYEAAKPGLVKFPDPTGNCCMQLIKPATASVFSSDKSAPAVITLDVPDSAAKSLEDDPHSAPDWNAFRTTGVLPKDYVAKVEILDHMDESKVKYQNAQLGDHIGLPAGTWRDVWDKQKHAIAAEKTQQIHIVWYGDLDELSKLLIGKSKTDVKAEALFRGIKVLGFTGPEEEFVNATASRVPPELLTNVKCIIAAPWLGAKHGQYMPDEKIIYLNPKDVRSRSRLGQGQGWINHGELTTVHEIMHSVYDNLPEAEQDQWLAVSGWMIGTQDGQASAYVEKRPGWEPYTSKWTHKTGVKFPRVYSEKNPDEDFSDCGAFYLLNKAHQIGTKKKAFFDDLFSRMVKHYTNYNVQSPEKPYGEKHVGWAVNALDIGAAIDDLLSSGTSEGVKKEWDSRGRGRKPVVRPLPEPQPPAPEIGIPIPSVRTDDGTVYYDENSLGGGRTHYDLIRDMKIPPERVVGGGFTRDGVYEESEGRSDAGRLGERARAAWKLGRPMTLDAYGTPEGVEKAWDTRGRGRKEEVHNPSLEAVIQWQDHPHMLYNVIEDSITGGHNPESDNATPEDKQHAAEILDGIRYGDRFSTSLYRGMHIDPNNDTAGILKMKEGDEFQVTRPASFSQNLGIASGFSYGVSKAERNVLFVTDGESQGLNVTKINQHSEDIGYEEAEVVTTGRFKVTMVEDSRNYGPTVYHKIHVQQLGVL